MIGIAVHHTYRGYFIIILILMHRQIKTTQKRGIFIKTLMIDPTKGKPCTHTETNNKI